MAPQDEELISSVDVALDEEAALIEKIELKAGLRRIMDAAQQVNVYLNSEEPWKVIKSDPNRGATVLWTAIQAIAGIKVGFSPYLPFTCGRVGEMLGQSTSCEGWVRHPVEAGTPMGEIRPLFTKLEPDALDS
jgi:methionyl-tRNA synthetase